VGEVLEKLNNYQLLRKDINFLSPTSALSKLTIRK
jgi:hypothetical protein